MTETMPTKRQPDHPIRAIFDLLLAHQHRFLAAFGLGKRRAVLAKLKEIVGFMAPGLGDGGAFRDKARRSQSLEEFGEVVESHLRPLLREQLLIGS